MTAVNMQKCKYPELEQAIQYRCITKKRLCDIAGIEYKTFLNKQWKSHHSDFTVQEAILIAKTLNKAVEEVFDNG